MRKLSMWFPNRSGTNRAVQAQMMARDWKFWIKKKRNYTIPVGKTKALISFAVTADLLLCFRIDKIQFSHDVAYLIL